MKQNNCVCSQNNKKNEITPLSAIETKKKNIFNKFWRKFKQWPLAPNSWDSLITRANVSRQVKFFSKMAFGECQRVWAKQVGKCPRVWRVRANPVGECWQVWKVQPIFKKGLFGEYSNLPKMANFRRVLKFNKFAVEWPLLKKTLCLFYEKHLSISLHFTLVQTLN